MQKKLKIYSDGGARGNPGPAAAAFLIISGDGVVLRAASFSLGKRTNNQAEYEALIAALESAVQLEGQEVVCHLDSELVGRQLTGEYSVRNTELKQLWCRVQELRRSFRHISFINVPRTNKFIKEADALVNKQLDQRV